MPLSRNPRMDRRKRILLDSVSQGEDTVPPVRTRASRSSKGDVAFEEVQPKRGAGYSQSVRRACQHRLVQFIPVRKRSLSAVVLAAVLVPTLLSAAHFGIFVGRVLPWDTHPVASVLDASHPRSLAAWLASHLWLLCLVTTVLTFQLRRHKLDDYIGEYRLWFWLVLTCLIGSIDSTTRVTQLFGAALDQWSQVQVGWSGNAIVQATLAVLIGMLGLRLCTELKSVPVSLVLWLFGLLCWAGSLAAAQSMLKLDVSHPMRSWCRATLWLAGLTSIWLSGLFYLRFVYIEAQRRFIVRGGLISDQPIAWRKQIADMSRKIVPASLIRGADPAERMSDEAAEYEKVVSAGRLGSTIFGAFRKRSESATPQIPNPSTHSSTTQSTASNTTGQQNAAPRSGWSKRFLTWRRSASPADEQIQSATGSQNTTARQPAATSTKHTNGQETSLDASQPRRSLMSRLKVVWPKKKSRQQESETAPVPSKKKKLHWPKMRIPKLKFPKIKFPSFALPPPTESDNDGVANPTNLKPTTQDRRPLPGTSPSADVQSTINLESARGISKAERKKLKRLQRDDEQDRRAA